MNVAQVILKLQQLGAPEAEVWVWDGSDYCPDLGEVGAVKLAPDGRVVITPEDSPHWSTR